MPPLDGVHFGLGDGSFRLDTREGSALLAGLDDLRDRDGDFGNDGHLDLAVADYLDNEVTIFMGDGRGNFRVAGSIPVGDHPTAMATWLTSTATVGSTWPSRTPSPTTSRSS